MIRRGDGSEVQADGAEGLHSVTARNDGAEHHRRGRSSSPIPSPLQSLSTSDAAHTAHTVCSYLRRILENSGVRILRVEFPLQPFGFRRTAQCRMGRNALLSKRSLVFGRGWFRCGSLCELHTRWITHHTTALQHALHAQKTCAISRQDPVWM